MIPLDLDDAVLDGAAATALFLEDSCQLLDLRSGKRNAADDDHGAAAASLDFAAQAHDAVTLLSRRFVRGGVLLLLYPPRFRRIDRDAVGPVCHFPQSLAYLKSRSIVRFETLAMTGR